MADLRSGESKVSIPESLEQLRVAEMAENPVVIAGAGRESTHKGYLSWILSSEKWGGATALVSSLLEHSHATGADVSEDWHPTRDANARTMSACVFMRESPSKSVGLVIANRERVRDFKLRRRRLRGACTCACRRQGTCP